MDQKRLARIIGHLQFDGYVPANKNARMFSYANTNADLIDEFVSDVETTFNLKPSFAKRKDIHQVYFYSAQVVRLLKQITKYHSYTWYVPDFILRGTEQIKIFYLQAFFDDEGYVSRTTRNANYIVIRGVSVNFDGLLGLQTLLRSIGIESNVKKWLNTKSSFTPNKCKCVLTITNYYNIQKFYGKIK